MFYKTCGQDCDITLNVYPHGLHDKVLAVLVNYQDPRDKEGIATKLPTWSTNPTWQVSIKYSSMITIEGTEPYFYSHEKHYNKKL